MQTQTKAAAPARQRATLSTRTCTSPKAAEPVPTTPDQLPDAAVPQPATEQPEQLALDPAQQIPADVPVEAVVAVAPEPESAPSDAAQPIGSPAPAPALAWSSDDESAFQAMLARRKAAGYQRRGKDVGAQLLRVGDIAANPGTVVAAIIALVAEYGTIGRAKLLDAMATATFPHPKAKPQDRGWCQGYVAGAVRDGFLSVADSVHVSGAGQ